jgi:hypothetical protein
MVMQAIKQVPWSSQQWPQQLKQQRLHFQLLSKQVELQPAQRTCKPWNHHNTLDIQLILMLWGPQQRQLCSSRTASSGPLYQQAMVDGS